MKQDKKKMLHIISKAANEYEKYLNNKYFLVVFPKGRKIEYVQIGFRNMHFLHLTGVKTKLSAQRFYYACLAGKLAEKDVEFDGNGRVQQKLMVLPHLHELLYHPCWIGDFVNNGVVIQSDYFIGDTKSILLKIKRRTLMENKIEVKQLSDRIYAMNDLGATGYLVLGNEKALVIDTMNASDDLGAVVRGITALPVMVVNTHGHGDHICGNIFFEEAYIHPDDLSLALEFASYPEIVEIIEKLGLPVPPFKEILEGTVIDLGGATVEVLLLPGHTKGGICLLYREERVLFTGDGINCHLWMQLDHSLQMKELKKSLENISWVKEKADKILHGHTMDYHDIALIDELYKGVCDLVEHPELSETDPDYNWFGGVAKQHVFGEGKVICYVPEKLK